MKILGIETSCDETAAAVVEDGRLVLSNVIASQIPLHQKTGGVVPEVAAREHVLKIIPVVEQALKEARVSLDELDAIAVTQGPGLLSSLVIGVSTASALAMSKGLPLIPVNHIAGHIYANWLRLPEKDRKLVFDHAGTPDPAPRGARKANASHPPLPPNGLSQAFGPFQACYNTVEIQFPAVVLTVSGGHNELVLMRDHVDFQLLGETLDDAAGEAFDKVARLLGLGYPGGPQVARAAHAGNSKRFDFPKSYLNNSYDFSFSGLKTAVLNVVKEEHAREGVLSEEFIADCAASFQEGVCGVLSDKLLLAVQQYKVKSVLLSGGVSANVRLREMIAQKIQAGSFPWGTSKPQFFFPQDFSFCTDNAAMIAGVAYFQYQKTRNKKVFQNYQVLADPNFGRF